MAQTVDQQHSFLLPVQTGGVFLLPAECPHRVLYTVPAKDGGGEFVRSKACRKRALPTGWCEEHRRSQELLDVGAALGYPRVVVIAGNFEKVIGQGLVNWRGYAEQASARTLAKELEKLRKLVGFEAGKEEIFL